MKTILTLIMIAAFAACIEVSGQTCDYFTSPNSTTVTGWTEQAGDWQIYNNTLQSPSSGVWNYITYNGSSQADGCITGRAIYQSPTQLQFMGLLGRFNSTSSNIAVKLQDNNGSGYWDSYYIYCDGTNISYASSGLNFGTDANIQMEYTGTNVTLRVDPDRNGTWDYTYSTTVTNTSAGLCGAVGYNVCYLDDWCYGASCSPASNCDYFTAANSTTIPGWTEQVGDWSIFSNMLQSPNSGWDFITYNVSAQTNGCVTGRAIYGSPAQTKFAGLVGRFISPSSYIMVKIQDNNSTGYWDSYYIYCDGSSINAVSTGLNFGTDADFQMEFTGASVTLRVDPDRNGTWDYAYTTAVTNTTSGLCGIGAYGQCFLDDWCYADSCCIVPPPAGTINGTNIVCAGQTGVSFSITPISNASSYIWSYTGTGATINGTGNNVTIDFSAGATTGNLTVYGQNSCGPGAASAALPVTVDPCTSIDQPESNMHIQIIPNPSQGLFSVNVNTTGQWPANIKITNIMGSQVLEKTLPCKEGHNRFDIDLSAHPAGIYYVIITGDKTRCAKTLMIAR